MTKEEWQEIITPLILEMEENSETSNSYQLAKEKFNNLLQKTEITKEDQGLLKKISKLLSKEQIISVSAQSSALQTFIQGEILDKKNGLVNELEKRYNQFSEREKLMLLNLGLKGVGIVNNEQKNRLLNILSTIETEKDKWLNYTQRGNQELGEFLFEGLNLTPEQETALKNLGLEAVGVNPDWKPTPQQKEQILNKIIRPLISNSLENNENKRKKFVNLELPKSITDKWQIKIGESQMISLPVNEEQKLSLFPLTQKEEKLLKSIAPTYLKTIKFTITLLQQIYSLGLEEKQLNFLENSEIIPNTKTDFIDKYEKHFENSYKEFKSELLKPIYQKFKIGQEEQEKTERQEFLVKHQSNYRLLIQTLQEEIFTENIRKFHGILLPLYSDSNQYSWDELLFPQRVYQIKNTPAGIFLDTQFLGLQISQKYHLIDILLITFVYQDWVTKQERLLEIAREELDLKGDKNKLFDLLPEEIKKTWLEEEATSPQILGDWKDFKNYLEREIVTYEDEQVVIRPERLEDYNSSPELEQTLTRFCDSLDATLDNQGRYHQLPTWENKNWEELIPYEKAFFGFKTNQKKLELKIYQQLGLIYQGYLTTKQTETLLASENEKKIIQQIESLEEKLRQLQTEAINCRRTITIQNILTNSDLVELFAQFLQSNFEFPDKEWEEWKDISPEFNQESVELWTKWGFDYWQTKEWMSIGLKTDDYSYVYWLEREGFEPERVLNEGDEATLQKSFEESKENEIELVILSVFEKKIKQLLIDYQICQKKKEVEKVLRREEIRKLMEGQGGDKSSLSEEMKSMFEVLQEKLERKLVGKPVVSSVYTTPSQSAISQSSVPQPKENEKPTKEEDADLPDWLKKQQERKRKQLEEDRKQLEQDRKITERKAKEAEEKAKLQEEERGQRKVEEEERRKRQEAEMEELKKRKLDELETIAKNTETEAKRAQDKLDAFIKEEELKKQRMEQKIKDLKAETEAKEKVYAEQEVVLKEQHQKELEALAADDKEKRQAMEKEFQTLEQERQRKHLEELRKIDDKIKREEDELEKKHLENQRKVEQMEKEAELATKEAERAKEDAKKTKEAYEKHKRETEEKDRQQKEEQDVIDRKTREERSKIFKLDKVQERAIDLISEHQPIEYDMEKGSLWYNKSVVTKFNGRTYWKVRQYWLNCPGIKFNPYRWHKTEEIESHVKTSDGSTYIPGIRDKWITSISVWLGDGWFTKEEMIERLKQIDRTNFFD